MNENEHRLMSIAMEEAIKAGDRDEVPIGAIIVDSVTGEVIAKDGNRTRELNDPTAHAEVLVIRKACEIASSQRIPNMDMYVTLEPCTMCAGAISFARISKVVIAAEDKKGGGIINGVEFYNHDTCHHKPSVVSGIMAEKSSELLKSFFKGKRK